jgi:parallel beta-helix repeat protein
VKRALLLLLLTAAAGQAAAATFVVTNTNDSGPGSLRQAILDANANDPNAGSDEIRFAVGFGPPTVTLLSALPAITSPITIDGRTQPGYQGSPIVEISGASAPPGSNGLRVVGLGAGSAFLALVINGFRAQFFTGGGHGILIEGGGQSEVFGCYIGTNREGTAAVRNEGDGIHIVDSWQNRIGCDVPLGTFANLISGNLHGVRLVGASTENFVSGNFIGTDVTGTNGIPNFQDGVAVLTVGGVNFIGSHLCDVPGPSTSRNLISGNGRNGVYVVAGTLVHDNRIGWNAAESGVLPNGRNGVEFEGVGGGTISANRISGNDSNGILLAGTGGVFVSDNVIGRRSVGRGNGQNGILLSGSNGNRIEYNDVGGNEGDGIGLTFSSQGNVVVGNRVGLGASSDDAVPNGGDGIVLEEGATENTVGGLTALDPNVIGNNRGHGIRITGGSTTWNRVVGNRIGVRPDLGPAPNLGHGIAIGDDASQNEIGGTPSGLGNFIGFNSGSGVFIESGTGNVVRGNAIALNVFSGIDLAPAGPNPNDPGDSDEGPNRGQNTPELNSALVGNGETSITGTLQSAADQLFTVDFYASSDCNPLEGGQYLGSTDVTTDGAGEASFAWSLSVIAFGRGITATATDSEGNTSEFSACVFTPLPVVSQILPTSGPASQGTAVVVSGHDFQTGASLEIGGIAASNVTVVNTTSITGITPALAPGTLNSVAVINPDSQAGVLPNGFLADFLDVPQGHGFHDFHRNDLSRRRDLGLRRRELLRRGGRLASAGRRVPDAKQVPGHRCPARDGNGLRRRPGRIVRRGLHRGLGRGAGHFRLRGR